MTNTMTRLFMLITVVGLADDVHAQAAIPRTVEPARSVTLSLVEYNRLTDLANRTPTSSPATPVAAVLANADLRVRVDGLTARGMFTLNGQVLRTGVNRVTLLTDGTVLDANVDGRPLPLIVDGRSHQALLPGPGPFTANLEWGSPLIFRPGRASFMLPVPPAGAVRATIDLPGDQADARLSAGSITRRTTLNGRTIIEATLDPSTPTEVWWSMRDSAPVASAREIRTIADVMTLVTLGDSDVRMVALIDLTVVQGEPRTVEMRLPAGYQLTGITGSSLEASEPVESRVVLTLADPAARRHQFLVTMERPHTDGSFTFDTGFVAVTNAERERGEVAVEGVGTLDLAATESGGMHRIDVREINPALQSLARTPLLAGFRFQRNPSANPQLSLAITRFPDSGVLAATVDSAVVTTLMTSEGRALTEVLLSVTNHAQPFLKVSLPAGATIVSLEVAGEPAKPVTGSDGTRVPLLRSGFRPTGPYQVSFVYLHAGTPFVRKGELAMTLPQMDVPVGVVRWEVFAPENYSLKYVGGNAITQDTLDRAMAGPPRSRGMASAVATPIVKGMAAGTGIIISLVPGEGAGRIRGTVRDTAGDVLPGVTVTVVSSSGATSSVISSGNGGFLITGLAQGPATITAQLAGFNTSAASFVVGRIGHRMDITLNVGSLAESVTVTGSSPAVHTARQAQKEEPSQNVINLQRRVAGVLPIRVEVPRAGTSYRFARPLVVNDETTVSFHYKRK
jgi:hypothetical protein